MLTVLSVQSKIAKYRKNHNTVTHNQERNQSTEGDLKNHIDDKISRFGL